MPITANKANFRVSLGDRTVEYADEIGSITFKCEFGPAGNRRRQLFLYDNPEHLSPERKIPTAEEHTRHETILNRIFAHLNVIGHRVTLVPDESTKLDFEVLTGALSLRYTSLFIPWGCTVRLIPHSP